MFFIYLLNVIKVIFPYEYINQNIKTLILFYVLFTYSSVLPLI